MTAPLLTDFTIRSFNAETDFPRLVTLLNGTGLTPTTEEAERAEYAQGANSPRSALVAEKSGEMAGFGITEQVRGPTGSANSYRVWVGVFPEERRQGIGSALFERLTAFTGEQGVTELWANARDDDTQTRAFLERRDFELAHHTFRSALDLTTFPMEQWAASVASVEASGIRFENFAAFGDSPEIRRRIFELNTACLTGEPTVGGMEWTFEQFEQDVFESPWFLPEGQIVALEGEEWVGLAAVGRFPGAEEAFHPFTGVRPEYRGRGIATALKVKAIQRAQELGAAQIRTNNDSCNAPMLAINRKLGYQPQPGMWRMRRKERTVAEPEVTT